LLPPPDDLLAIAAETPCIVASDLRRARESAAWLAGATPVRVESELREAPLPESLGVPLRLPPGAWVVLARVLWLLNAGAAVESVAQTRQRAQRVADRLEALAVEHDSVMAVGHGMFNRFVASALRRRGWHGPRHLPRPYWAAAPFTRDA
jgi:broad specificity phosphatase PhoE